MVAKLIITLLGIACSFNCISQAKWSIPIFFENFGRYHYFTNDVNLNDTTIVKDSKNTFFKIVLFDSKGKCYFEAYKNNKIIEKGYYENSLDTLKKYSTQVGSGGKKTLKILKYFYPLKNGDWYEYKKGKIIKSRYDMGIVIKDE